MKLVLWILIGISLLSLLFIHCPCESVFENMAIGNAVDVAKEYVDNLTEQKTRADQTLGDAVTLVSATNDKIATATLNKANASTNDDKLKYELELIELNVELAKHQKEVVYLNNQITRLADLITEQISAKDKLVTQSENTVPETSADLNGVAFVPGPGNTMIELKPTGDLGGSQTYYEPGTYKFGSSTYVPSYEDSVYLSKTTGMSSVSGYLDPATMKGGACSYFKNQPLKLEEMCNSVDKNNCGAMSCCVLLGGAKCVSGNEAGPYSKTNYGDITIRDKDYYYYNGKCYGNCKP